jgi:predicted NBD/HSP70 family sugar kinase
MPRRNRIVVGVDLGGTNVFAAVVNTREGELLGQAKRLTEAEQGAEAVTARIAETVKNAIKRAGLKKKYIWVWVSAYQGRSILRGLGGKLPQSWS